MMCMSAGQVMKGVCTFPNPEFPASCSGTAREVHVSLATKIHNRQTWDGGKRSCTRVRARVRPLNALNRPPDTCASRRTQRRRSRLRQSQPLRSAQTPSVTTPRRYLVPFLYLFSLSVVLPRCQCCGQRFTCAYHTVILSIQILCSAPELFAGEEPHMVLGL